MPSDTPRQILPGLPDPDSLADPDSGSFEPLVAKRNSPDSAKSSDSGTTIHLGGDSLVWSSVSPKMPRLIDEETPTSKVLWRDSLDSSLLVVAKGKGIVIVSATGLRIADFDFCRFDHAELFLRFLSWKAKPKNVWLISDSTFPSWAQWLWFHAWAVLLWIFALLGLWILGRARRFGPILSDEEPERRPLLEHIDASARWIWNAPDGPQTLLSALRDSVRQKLAWRHPAWSRLPLGELSQELSRLHKVSAKATQRALDPNSPTHSPTAQEFTKMVRILQQLKETP